MIYLDYNASAPLRSSAKEFIREHLDCLGNPSAIHGAGRLARKGIETAREQIAKTLNILPKRIVFTSGATEADNHIIKNYPGLVIFSALEHDAVYKARDDFFACGVTPQGTIDLNHLEDLLKQLEGKKPLVSVVAAHNETGIIQPLEDVHALCKQYGALFHVDAAQAIGRMTFAWETLDYISLSSHKIGGLSGVGALIVNEHIPLRPLILGGGQERSFRSGTENVLGIMTFGHIFQEAFHQEWDAELRNYLESEIIKMSPQSVIVGQDINRIKNTSLMTMPFVQSVTQVMYFDLHQICVSAGSACSSGKVKTSRTLQAMGAPQTVQDGALRVSLCDATTKAEIDQFLFHWKNLYERENQK
ncbi:MAG: Cysteine desulfurase IscS [Holosporales bacterium]